MFQRQFWGIWAKLCVDCEPVLSSSGRVLASLNRILPPQVASRARCMPSQPTVSFGQSLDTVQCPTAATSNKTDFGSNNIVLLNNDGGDVYIDASRIDQALR